jgi:putative transposase
VDQDGTVLDILLQSKRDAKAAKRFMAKLMKKQRRTPRVLVTDKLRSYGVAHRELMSSVDHRSHKGLNNRAENSHRPTRQRERAIAICRLHVSGSVAVTVDQERCVPGSGRAVSMAGR